MSDQTFRDREILSAAQAKGPVATLGAFFRLSGPGWLQSAITLGGGSLAGALYLGMTGGYSLLWVQVLAMFCGVVMLSAISYITLSTGKKPYAAMNEYINPVLGTAWITATILANMIFILPQFSLAFDALDKNLFPEMVAAVGERESKYIVSGILAVIAAVVVLLSLKPGWMAKTFDLLLKLIVGAIVVCFVIAVVQLAIKGQINADLLMGFVPDLWRLMEPAPALNELLKSETMSEKARLFWSDELLRNKHEKMIATVATAVGINMTFLLPYSMLARGWDRTFRGLARWDLITGMAIPFVIVTSCIVITTAYVFHGKADESLLSDDPAIVMKSKFFDTVANALQGDKGKLAAVGDSATLEKLASLDSDVEKRAVLAELVANMSAEERTVAVSLAKPDTNQLAKSLEPLLGKQNSNLVFGIGVLAMAFSTIIILSLINGFAVAEIFGNFQNTAVRVGGSLLALAVGVAWVELWTGDSKTYLAIVASTFAMLLLPIAYLAFLLMMNNRSLMGSDKPSGARLGIWNILMVFSLAIASTFAYRSLVDKLDNEQTGGLVLGGVVTFGLLVLVGFSATLRRDRTLPGQMQKDEA